MGSGAGGGEVKGKYLLESGCSRREFLLDVLQFFGDTVQSKIDRAL